MAVVYLAIILIWLLNTYFDRPNIFIIEMNAIRSFGCNGLENISLMKAFIFAGRRPYVLWCVDTNRNINGQVTVAHLHLNMYWQFARGHISIDWFDWFLYHSDKYRYNTVYTHKAINIPSHIGLISHLWYMKEYKRRHSMEYIQVAPHDMHCCELNQNVSFINELTGNQTWFGHLLQSLV